MSYEVVKDIGLEDRADIYEKILEALSEEAMTLPELMDALDDPENRSRHTVQKKLSDLQEKNIIGTRHVGSGDDRSVYYHVVDWSTFKGAYYDRVRRSLKRNIFDPVDDLKDSGVYFED